MFLRKIRARTRAALLVGTLVLFLIPAFPPPASAATTGVAGFAVGTDGRLYLVARSSSGQLLPPAAISSTGLAPAGAAVAAAAAPNARLAAFVIGTDGGLKATISPASGGWTTFAIGPPDLAPAGGNLAATGVSDGIRVFFAGQNGAIYQAFLADTELAGRPDPEPATPIGLAPPGSAIAAVRLTGPRAAAFLVDVNGRLSGVWQVTSGWLSIFASPFSVAAPGGGVAATSSSSGVRAFYASTAGRLTVVSTTSTTGSPVFGTPSAITATGTVPSGANLAGVSGPAGTSAVFFFGGNGAIHTVTNPAGVWQDRTTAPAGTGLAGGRLSATAADSDFDVDWCWTGRFWRGRLLWPPPPPPNPWNAGLASVATGSLLAGGGVASAAGAWG